MSIQSFSFHISWPKLVCSLPILLVTLYFVPPLGVVLTIARYFIYGGYHYHRVPAVLLIIGAACLVPRFYELLQNNIGESIPVFQPLIDFRTHQLYSKLTDFGRFVSIFSIIVLIASQLLKNVISKVSGMIRMASMTSGKNAGNNSQQNTRTMQKDGKPVDPSDQETPHVVKCPSCGKANHIIGTVGTCKSCRNPIEWQPRK